MNRLLLLLLLVSPVAAQAQVDSAAAKQPTFAYLLRLPERLWDYNAWTKDDQAKAGAHFQYLKSLVAKGIVEFVGRTDPPYPNNKVAVTPVGFVVFHAKDLAEAEAIMRADPAIAAGMMLGEVQPFAIVMNPSAKR